jgi:hypothetical protein
VTVPPVITQQPVNVTTNAGGSATFSVTVNTNSTRPLNYRWYFKGTNALGGATNTSLTLINVQTTNAGNYSVVVANVAGSVTSSNAVLTVTVRQAMVNDGTLVSPLTLSILGMGAPVQLQNSQVQLLLQGKASGPVEIQTSTDLVHWTTLQTLTNLNGTLDYIDPFATNFSQRFYRLVTP